MVGTGTGSVGGACSREERGLAPYSVPVPVLPGADQRRLRGILLGQSPFLHSLRSSLRKNGDWLRVPVPVPPSRLSDFTNKRPCRETKHPNDWKELSKLSPPEPAEKSKGSGLVSVDRLKKSLDNSKSSWIGLRLVDFIDLASTEDTSQTKSTASQTKSTASQTKSTASQTKSTASLRTRKQCHPSDS